MSARALIWSAFPRGPAKHLEAALGCSPRQAWRIVSTGKVPERFRDKIVKILDEAIARNERELRTMRRQLRAREHGLVEGVDMAAGNLGSFPEMAAGSGQAAGPEEPLLIGDAE